MKNYRFLVPILLVLLLVASMFSLFSEKLALQQTYDAYLDAARDYREQGIYIDAQRQYMLALEERRSVELYLELDSLYEQFGMDRARSDLLEELLVLYPEEVAVYERAMDVYISAQDYIECFDLKEQAEKRGLHSDHLDAAIGAIEYQFYLVADYENVGVYAGGMCPVQIGDKWGFVDQMGTQFVAARYLRVGPFSSEGIAPVVDADGSAYFIDTQGYKKKVVRNVDRIQELGLIEGDVFRLFDGTVYGFYEPKGTCLFGGYEDASNIANGVAAVCSGGSWKLVDNRGKDLTGKTYAAVRMDEKQTVFRNERAFVSDGQSWQMIDSTGRICGEEAYEDVRVFADSTLAAVKIGGKWGFVDKNGSLKIAPEYEDARSFCNGFAAVKIDGKWGFIDPDNELVLAAAFTDAKDFTSSGTVYVHTGSEWELLVLYKYNH